MIGIRLWVRNGGFIGDTYMYLVLGVIYHISI